MSGSQRISSDRAQSPGMARGRSGIEEGIALLCIAMHPATSSLPRDGARCLLRRIWILCTNKDGSTLLRVPHLTLSLVNSGICATLAQPAGCTWKICMRKHGDLRVCERAECSIAVGCWPRRIFYSTMYSRIQKSRRDACSESNERSNLSFFKQDRSQCEEIWIVSNIIRNGDF